MDYPTRRLVGGEGLGRTPEKTPRLMYGLSIHPYMQVLYASPACKYTTRQETSYKYIQVSCRQGDSSACRRPPQNVMHVCNRRRDDGLVGHTLHTFTPA
jgi:hypothetical protein